MSDIKRTSMTKLIILLAMYSQTSCCGEVKVPSIEEIPVQETGVASWYGSGHNNDNGLHGSVTATGEVFDPSRRTCASRTIPLNTTVIVRLNRTGKAITCRVNDRGPYGAIHEGTWTVKLTKKDPGEWRGVMDLSRKSAEDVGLDFNKGMEPVSIHYWR